MGRRHRHESRDAIAPAKSPQIAMGNGVPVWLDGLLTAATLTIICLAMIRCIVPVTANLVWETDPRQATRITSDVTGNAPTAMSDADDVVPSQFFGPAGAGTLDAMSVAVAAAALLLHVMAGGALRCTSITLGFIGIGFCFAHMNASVENAFHLGSWIGAISLALAALHLASRGPQRRWFVATLVAVTVPLFIDAARYVLMDHRETVEMFRSTEDAFLAARGWAKGSPEHLMYVRRMEFAEPTGAFTFSNILGSIAAALTVMSGCIAVGLWQQRSKVNHRWVLPAIVAMLGAITVLLTHSKGAPVALVMAAGLVVLTWWMRGKARAKKIVPIAAIGLVLIAVLIVVVRGMAGPPQTVEGERSLLFRWQYWQAAARITTQSTGSILRGVGPSQFAEDYQWARNPLNPEDIRSAHNVFADDVAMLGLGGVAMGVLLILWLMQAARNGVQALNDDEEELPAPPVPASANAEGAKRKKQSLHVAPADIAWTIAFLLGLFGTEMAVRSASHGTPERFLLWSLGMIAVFFLTAVLASPGWLLRRWTPLALMAAGAVLLIHAQIEMTFFQASSAPIAWLVLGIAAAGRDTNPSVSKPKRAIWMRAMPAAALMIFAIVMSVTITAPLAKQQTLLADAERSLRARPPSWASFNQTLALLEQSETVGPHNVKPYEWQARLQMEIAFNMSVGLRDVPAAKIRPEARQEIRRLVLACLAALDRAQQHGLNAISLRRQQAQMLVYAADLLSEPLYAEQAVSLWHEIVTRRPYAWPDRVELADMLWRISRESEAREQYRKALELSDAMYLEPTRMMPALERKRIEDRLTKSK